MTTTTPPPSASAGSARPAEARWRERFWCPLDGRMSFDRDGYLLGPDGTWKAGLGASKHSDVVPFFAIADTPCLVLLGEPGLGKSWALQEAAREAQSRFSDDLHLFVNLGGKDSNADVLHSVFNDPTFQEWAKGNSGLHLYLDSLDECLLRVETVAALLSEEFKRHRASLHRLFLRIACRSAEWPQHLEESLRELYKEVRGQGSVGVYNLAPFRRDDVFALAQQFFAPKHNDKDSGDQNNQAQEFVALLGEREVVPLAVRPLTLRFLLNVFARGRFPESRAELYREGCARLCAEVRDTSRSKRRAEAGDAFARLGIARRIAALLVFGRRSAVWDDFDLGDVPDFDLTLPQILGSSANAANGAQPNGTGQEEDGLNAQSLSEVLGSALFAPQTLPQRLAFAHQTYAEFLAADFLSSHNVPQQQVWSLISHPDDPGKIVPQLSETAAWLASCDPQLFRRILQTDPPVLLRSDVATAEPKDRAALVAALLHMVDVGDLIDTDWSLRHDYPKLDHPAIAEQLRPYIVTRDKDIVVRRVAIDIAESCRHASGLQDLLAALALDRTEELHVREQAAHAVMAMGAASGETNTRLRLKPLATQEQSEDLNDELKGAALTGLWPGLISAEEVFAGLHPNRNSELFGAYEAFLVYHLPRHLRPDDLPVALQWCARQTASHELRYGMRRLMGRVFSLAWRFLHRPSVLSAFVEAFVARMEHHETSVAWNGVDLQEVKDAWETPDCDEDAFESEPSPLSPDEKRKLLVEVLVARLSKDKEPNEKQLDTLTFSFYGPHLVGPQDLSWLLERLQSAPTTEVASWARLVRMVFTDEGAEQIFEVSQRVPALWEEFEPFFAPVELGSERARRMKEAHEGWNRWERQREQKQAPPRLDPPASERVQRLLDAFETGDLDAWWHLNLDLTLEETSTRYSDELEFDLSLAPGWREADAATRARILRAASEYLEKRESTPQKWFGQNVFFRPAAAAFRALALLLREDPDTFARLSPQTWRKWAPVTLWYPTSSESSGDAMQQELVRHAYRNAPNVLIESLLAQIDIQNANGDTLFVVRKLAHSWDERLCEVVFEKAQDPALKASSLRSLLEPLLEQNFQPARRFAESLLELPATDEVGRQRAHAAAMALLFPVLDGGWPIVWSAIERDEAFGREVLEEVAHRADALVGARLSRRLTADELAALFLWLARAFPHAQDPHVPDAHFVSPRESVSRFRDQILQTLKDEGTPEAAHALSRIVGELPEVPWIRYVLLAARHNALRGTWIPPQPEEILALVHSSQARLVQSGEQLLSVLQESLERLNLKLQGETPAAPGLWDKNRPKDENALSDVIKLHLQEDLAERGIVVNREVEIRRGEGPNPGERTDIQVNAVARLKTGEYQPLGVIIEVKGCWHPELKTAMQTQLKERYLAENPGRHGLYVVGWHLCPAWDESDPRRARVPFESIEAARRFLERQARRFWSVYSFTKALGFYAGVRFVL